MVEISQLRQLELLGWHRWNYRQQNNDNGSISCCQQLQIKHVQQVTGTTTLALQLGLPHLRSAALLDSKTVSSVDLSTQAGSQVPCLFWIKRLTPSPTAEPTWVLIKTALKLPFPTWKPLQPTCKLHVAASWTLTTLRKPPTWPKLRSFSKLLLRCWLKLTSLHNLCWLC
jgi:hypothetical protein